jgi:hypothetical protein
MGTEKPVRRLTLRQLLTQAEKCARDLIENCHTYFLPRASEFRDLTRPVRRRSQYPTMLAVQNSLRKLQQASDDMQALASYLQEHLDAIREHANRERGQRP